MLRGNGLHSSVAYMSSASEIALVLSPCENLGNRHQDISCCSSMSVGEAVVDQQSNRQLLLTCVPLGYGRKPGRRMCNYAKGNENTEFSADFHNFLFFLTKTGM